MAGPLIAFVLVPFFVPLLLTTTQSQQQDPPRDNESGLRKHKEDEVIIRQSGNKEISVS